MVELKFQVRFLSFGILKLIHQSDKFVTFTFQNFLKYLYAFIKFLFLKMIYKAAIIIKRVQRSECALIANVNGYSTIRSVICHSLMIGSES